MLGVRRQLVELVLREPHLEVLSTRMSRVTFTWAGSGDSGSLLASAFSTAFASAASRSSMFLLISFSFLFVVVLPSL